MDSELAGLRAPVTASSRCEVCGLQYAEWDTDETYFCHGSK